MLLADQDRTQWDHAAIAEGVTLVREALRRRPPGRFALMAAIAAVHDEAPSWDATDWSEIVGLYDLLVEMWPSPVVALNRAVAIGLAEGPAAGLAALDALATEPLLATYSYLASARADFLRRLDRTDEARVAYEEALLLSENEVERAFLADRLGQLDAEINWAGRRSQRATPSRALIGGPDAPRTLRRGSVSGACPAVPAFRPTPTRRTGARIA